MQLQKSPQGEEGVAQKTPKLKPCIIPQVNLAAQYTIPQEPHQPKEPPLAPAPETLTQTAHEPDPHAKQQRYNIAN